MKPRIAIPVPHSGLPEYVERSLPQYERAVEIAGGEPVRIPLDQTPEQVMKTIERCDAVRLYPAAARMSAAKYDQPRHPKTADADSKRDTVDELLLQDAYNMRKPILGICYGMQTLNVYRTGSLIQDIESPINHAVGRTVPIAHSVEIEPGSKLAQVVGTAKAIPVNSSHHQSADTIGDGLRVVARSPQDGIIEAVEGTSPDHFVLAVQWHPERSVDQDVPSRAIFHALVEAAKVRHEQLVGEFETL